MKLARAFFIIFSLAATAGTFAQSSPGDVRVKLSLVENKTTYRIGDPIRVALEFTADRDGYQVDTVNDNSESSTETILSSVDSSFSHWRRDYFGLGYRDVIAFAKISQSPARIEFTLNDSIRFDHPGRYSIRILTRRVSRVSTSKSYEYVPPTPLTTNEITLNVEPMSETAEQAELDRLSKSLDSSNDPKAQTQVCEQLSFLTGNRAAVEKVRRFTKSDGPRCDFYTGLFISANHSLVLELLEGAIRDPNVEASRLLLGAVTQMRLIKEGHSVKPEGFTGVVLSPHVDPRYQEIRDAYVGELAAGLGKRTGKNQTTAAMTILMHLPKDQQVADPLLREARRILVQQFDSLHEFDREYMLRQYWEQLRDPSLVPSLKKMLGGTGMASKNIHEAALKRLIEIAPDEARPYVIAEINDPMSFVDLEVLGSLKDAQIPEVDTTLLSQIRGLASSKGVIQQMYLKQKASLAVRYATQNIYQDLMQIYRDNSASLAPDSRASMLAYFARHNEQEALPLIEEAVNAIPTQQNSSFLPQLTQQFYSDNIDAFLRKRLESEDPETASMAAYVISSHGPANDQQVLEARLRRWRETWADRQVEADANSQGRIEVELVMGLTRGKELKLSRDAAKALQQSCVTKMCRQTFPQR